jgi:CysZ protein
MPENKKFSQKVKQSNQLMVAGLQLFLDAHVFIWQNKLKRYLLISGFAFLILFSISIQGLLHWIDLNETWITKWLLNQGTHYIKLSKTELKYGVNGIFWLVRHSINANKDSFFTSIFLIIGTPYFSLISRKVHQLLLTHPKRENLGLLAEIWRGIKLSISNSFKQFGLILVITGLSFIPVLSILTPLMTFVVLAYYNGILMMDYSLERNGFTIQESRVIYKQNKSLLFALGLGFMFILLIPVIGWFLAPTYALVGGALVYKNYIQVNANTSEYKAS